MEKESLYISGPISAHIFEHNQRNFFMFGDEHFSLSGGCTELERLSCDRYDYKMQNIIKSPEGKCLTLTALLTEWFKYNKENKIKTDFYLEFPYNKAGDLSGMYDIARTELDDRRLGRKRPPNVREMTPEQRKELLEKDPLNKVGWIGTTALLFEQCLVSNKVNCPYLPIVRIHYADVRQYFEPTREVGRQAQSKLVELFTSQYFEINGLMETLTELILKENISLSLVYDYLIDFLKALDEYVLINELLVGESDIFFQLYMNVNGYENNRDVLLSLIPTETMIGESFKRDIENMSKVSKYYDGVYMHRTAAQISKLASESAEKKAIADLIISYSESYTQDIVSSLSPLVESLRISYDQLVDYMNGIDENEFSFSHLETFFTLFSEMRNELSEAANSLISLGANVMDVYLLARCFRLDDSKEVIIFAGANHIKRYVNFFTQYLDAKTLANHPNVNGEVTKRCVNIPELEKIINIRAIRENF